MATLNKKDEVERLDGKINVLQIKSILDTCKDQITILTDAFNDFDQKQNADIDSLRDEFKQQSIQLTNITTYNEGFSEAITELRSEIKNLIKSEMTVKEAIEDLKNQNQVLRDEKSIIQQNMQLLEVKVKTESEARQQANDKHAVILSNEKEKYDKLHKEVNVSENSLKLLSDKLE